MVENRPDWCISRQRTWGVPIALFVHRQTGDLHPDSVALVEAVGVLEKKRGTARSPVHGQVAAVSVGIYEGHPVLDLDYAEDSEAETDLNVVMNDNGGFIEIQGTAEGHAFRRDELDAMLSLAESGVATLCALQRSALEG